MANEATGTIWGLPNYTGELFTSDPINTPFLSIIGGLTGGVMTDNFEFSTDSQYSHESLGQKSITENQSIAGITPVNFVRNQSKNVTQIFQEEMLLSYVKQSNQGRLSGINTAGAQNNVVSEKDWQIAKHLESMARTVEWHFLNGTYNIATTSDTANQTRGMLAACTVNTVDAASAALSVPLVNELLLEMFTNGANFSNIVLFMGGYQHVAITNLYAYAPESRTIGGANLQQIVTSYGNIMIAPPHRMMPTDDILFADITVCEPVFQPVPGKGNLFYEDLAKTGAADSGQLFAQIGLNHGPVFMHGSLTSLATS
ncbi:MAG: DUF5309 family protein [Phycisphaerales bacterium]|jgi:hypothetical protein